MDARVKPAHDEGARHSTMKSIRNGGQTIAAAAFALLATLALASPACADRCEDIAGQLKGQIDGLKVGITAARVVYLSHPDAKELSLGCRGRDYSNELYAKSDGRKPWRLTVQVRLASYIKHHYPIRRKDTSKSGIGYLTS